MERNINFRMQIAGDGPLCDMIQAHIKEKGYERLVSMMGYLPREQMNRFWNDQDIFINVSECEGVGLSMLEAMGNGCVPVVTRVAGSEEFVTEGIGYVCDIGGLNAMAEKVAFLDLHRELLAKMGQSASKSAREKCSVEAYVDHLLGMVSESVEEFLNLQEMS